jgi:uncharacterized protein (DUF927 family)
MDASLQLFGVMMAVMTPIILIVLISEYFKYKKANSAQLNRLDKELHSSSTRALEQEVASLRQRIQVLEEIVTDRGFEVDRKIGNL